MAGGAVGDGTGVAAGRSGAADGVAADGCGKPERISKEGSGAQFGARSDELFFTKTSSPSEVDQRFSDDDDHGHIITWGEAVIATDENREY